MSKNLEPNLLTPKKLQLPLHLEFMLTAQPWQKIVKSHLLDLMCFPPREAGFVPQQMLNPISAKPE